MCSIWFSIQYFNTYNALFNQCDRCITIIVARWFNIPVGVNPGGVRVATSQILGKRAWGVAGGVVGVVDWW